MTVFDMAWRHPHRSLPIEEPIPLTVAIDPAHEDPRRWATFILRDAFEVKERRNPEQRRTAREVQEAVYFRGWR